MAELIVEEPIRLVAETKGLAIGPRGKSAYQLAVENGFPGTVEQWLESLKGEPGEPGSAEPQIQADLNQRDNAQVDFIKNRPRYPKRWKGVFEFGTEEVSIARPYVNIELVNQVTQNQNSADVYSVCVAAVVGGVIGYVSDANVFTENNDGNGGFDTRNFYWDAVPGADYYVLYFNRISNFGYFQGELIFTIGCSNTYINESNVGLISGGVFDGSVSDFPEKFRQYPINLAVGVPANVQVDTGSEGEVYWNILVEVRSMNAYGQLSQSSERMPVGLKYISGQGMVPAMISWDSDPYPYHVVSNYGITGEYRATRVTGELSEDLWQFD